MDKNEAISKAEAYKKVLKQNFPYSFEQLYLFGSYAKNLQHEDSDIDVAVVVNHFEGDFFSTMPLLWQLTRQVDNRIEPVLVAKDTDYVGFLDEIKGHGIEIV
jgi:predicted nucleotidyltransferase